VNLVNNVDLISSPDRGESHILPQFTDLIDTVITRSIDFEHVEADTSGDLTAGIAFSTGVNGWSVYTVQSLGQNPRRRRFTCSAWPDEEISMREPLLDDRVLQRLNDVILSQKIVKELGSILASEDLVTHGAKNNAENAGGAI
jgi:hypothetical protein